MPNYRRVWVPGGTYFFTVTLANRSSTLLVDRIDALRRALRVARHVRPFEIDAIVVMPDHLHAIWTLPIGDADYSTRWSHIKAEFSRAIPSGEFACTSRRDRRERGIWQRRFWARAMVDERDFAAHIDYVHFNPVKHGYANSAAEWPWSSFHRFVREGLLDARWGS
jgi:putative transposase